MVMRRDDNKTDKINKQRQSFYSKDKGKTKENHQF